MTNRFHALALALFTCSSITLHAMDQQQSSQLSLGTPLGKSTTTASAFIPNYGVLPKTKSIFSQEGNNELISLILDIKIAQELLNTKDPVNGMLITQASQPVVDLTPLEEAIATRTMKIQEAKIYAQNEAFVNAVAQKKAEIDQSIANAEKRIQNEKIELQKDLETKTATIIANAKKEEAATLSIFQRNPKKTILVAVATGFALPFVLPEVLKKAGL